MTSAQSEDTDQPWHLPSLISGRCPHEEPCTFSYPLPNHIQLYLKEKGRLVGETFLYFRKRENKFQNMIKIISSFRIENFKMINRTENFY